jgi:hypothetical protein
MNETRIVTQALAHLKGTAGITGEWHFTDLNQKGPIDGTIELLINEKEVMFHVEVKTELRDYQFDQIRTLAEQYRKEKFIVAAERIAPGIKAQLRKEKINYLDVAGNIFLDTGNYMIWLDGNKLKNETKPVINRAFTKTGLKVVFHLLNNPDAINLTYRELANATGVALGNITYVIDGLRETGFILQVDTKNIRLQNKRELLERWIDGYRESLKPSLYLGLFTIPGNQNWRQLPVFMQHNLHYFIGGEPAAEQLTKGYLIPEVITIYTDQSIVQTTKDLRIVQDRIGKVKLYEKFWWIDTDRNIPFTPVLLVYADLIITGDPRCLETAERIYNEFLANGYQ